jgi:putative photosynthetic complex assembly protein 2
MHPFGTGALYCLFVWWFSTGLIVFLNNLPKATFKWSFGAFSVVALIALFRLAQGSHDTSIGGAYAAFTYGVLVWGWHEMAFFMGILTGPRKTASPQGVSEWRRFGMGVAACIDHELAILATAVAVLWASWGAPNQVGCWTFFALWGMRQSAKLNVFLGVLNLGEAFVPAHLGYLISFMTRRRMNWLMPFSLLGGSFLVAQLVHKAGAAGVTPFQQAGYGCLITMLALAVLEHALLVLPLPLTALWGFWLRHAGRQAQPALAGVGEAPAPVQTETRRRSVWVRDGSFNLAPVKTAF